MTKAQQKMIWVEELRACLDEAAKENFTIVLPSNVYVHPAPKTLQ